MKILMFLILICLIIFPNPAYCSDRFYNLFGGICKLGIAYWGFSQETTYGNVTGTIFGLRGTYQILVIKW